MNQVKFNQLQKVPFVHKLNEGNYFSIFVCVKYLVIVEIQNFGSFSPDFSFQAEWKKPKNMQLELWLEPARLGLITSSNTVLCLLQNLMKQTLT